MVALAHVLNGTLGATLEVEVYPPTFARKPHLDWQSDPWIQYLECNLAKLPTHPNSCILGSVKWPQCSVLD